MLYVKGRGQIALSAFKSLVPRVSEKTLYRDLQDLVNRGILRQVGEKGEAYQTVRTQGPHIRQGAGEMSVSAEGDGF